MSAIHEVPYLHNCCALILTPVSEMRNHETLEGSDEMLDVREKAESKLADKDALAIASALRAARQSAIALLDYPGSKPTKLSDSYLIQDHAIAAWPDAIAGWKVGRILGDLVDVHKTDRLIGPIFKSSIQRADGATPVSFTAFEGGFCAVEGEYVFELDADANPDRTDYDTQSALTLIRGLWTGIEIAASPLAKINEWGPAVVVSDFGNNKGLILGKRLDDWQSRLADLHCAVTIESALVGRGSVSAFPGGIAQSLVFALNCAAKRGMPLKAGMFVSTGAVSGVHNIGAGQSAFADFGSDGTIYCQRRDHRSPEVPSQ
jgi:2-keto-4-pentenoate hydratase